ncbi:hypothetical protein, partial [Nonomuraea rubra]|uniref:hypothetical protein n=1 Tax=Nonomuraea rubra TaxID=46180 RepID=UPI0036140A97
ARRRAAAAARAARSISARARQAQRALQAMRRQQQKRWAKREAWTKRSTPNHRPTNRNAYHRQSPPKTQRTPVSGTQRRYDWNKIHEQVFPGSTRERYAFSTEPETPAVMFKQHDPPGGPTIKYDGRGGKAAAVLKIGELLVRLLRPAE